MYRGGSKNVILTSKSEKKTVRRISAWWRPTLRVAKAVPRIIIYLPLLVFFGFLCEKGCAEAARSRYATFGAFVVIIRANFFY